MLQSERRPPCQTTEHRPVTDPVARGVENGTKAINRREFCAAEPGGSDGLRVDVEGNLWCAWGGGEAEDGVAVFAPDGTMIGRIMLPERCANVCFGGIKRNRLFMAASQSIYSLYVEAQGAPGG